MNEMANYELGFVNGYICGVITSSTLFI